MDVDRLRAARPLLRRSSVPAPDGLIVEVTAPSPGWEYVDTAAYGYPPGKP